MRVVVSSSWMAMLVLCMCCIHGPVPSAAVLVPAEVTALQDLNALWDIPTWTGTPSCVDETSNWEGIVCSSNGNHVVQINFDFPMFEPEFMVSHPLPTWFFDRFPELEVCRLRGFVVTGTVPVSVTGAARLSTLDLSHNEFLTGSVAPLAPSLSTVDLSHTGVWALESPLPTQPGLVLNLAGANINTTLPVDDVTNLVELSADLKQTIRSGNAVIEWPNTSGCTQLTTLALTLDRHVRSGPLPVHLWPPSLQHLWLRGDGEDGVDRGDFPSALNGVNFPALASLDVASMNVHGSIPTELGSITTLETLSLTSMAVQGSLPSELASIPSLVSFWINNLIDLTGAVPDFATGGANALESLTITNTHISQLPAFLQSPPQQSGLASLRSVLLFANCLDDPPAWCADTVCINLISCRDDAATASPTSAAFTPPDGECDNGLFGPPTCDCYVEPPDVERTTVSGLAPIFVCDGGTWDSPSPGLISNRSLTLRSPVRGQSFRHGSAGTLMVEVNNEVPLQASPRLSTSVGTQLDGGSLVMRFETRPLSSDPLSEDITRSQALAGLTRRERGALAATRANGDGDATIAYPILLSPMLTGRFDEHSVVLAYEGAECDDVVLVPQYGGQSLRAVVSIRRTCGSGLSSGVIAALVGAGLLLIAIVTIGVFMVHKRRTDVAHMQRVARAVSAPVRMKSSRLDDLDLVTVPTASGNVAEASNP